MHNCVDCEVNTSWDTGIKEYYLVHDEVWEQAGMDYLGGMLCISCLENRLGRELTPADFPDMLINRGLFPQSERLRQRCGFTGEYVELVFDEQIGGYRRP